MNRKSLLLIMCLLLGAFKLQAQVYSPVDWTTINKPLGVNGFDPDGRKLFYDRAKVVRRPFRSTSEVLSYFPNPLSRLEQLTVIINTGGTLSATTGKITGGTNAEWWFRNGVTDGDLVIKTSSSGIQVIYADSFADTNTGVDATTHLNEGSAIVKAIRSCPGGGCEIKLGNKAYEPTLSTSNYPFTLNNIRITGSQRPNYSTDARSLTGGTIIKGTLYFLNSNNITLTDLGMDFGANYVAAYGNGPSDGIIFTGGTNHTGDNLIFLAPSPTSVGHCLLDEAGFGSSYTNITTMYCIYGVVIKSYMTKLDNITNYQHNYAGTYFKSDNIVGRCIGTVAGSITFGYVPRGITPYIIQANKTANAVIIESLTDITTDINIQTIQSSVAGVGLLCIGYNNQPITDVTIGTIKVDESNIGIQLQGVNFKRVALGSLYLTNCSGNGIYTNLTNSDYVEVQNLFMDKGGSPTAVAVDIYQGALSIHNSNINNATNGYFIETSNSALLMGRDAFTNTFAPYVQNGRSPIYTYGRARLENTITAGNGLYPNSFNNSGPVTFEINTGIIPTFTAGDLRWVGVGTTPVLATVPSSSTASGQPGQVSYDANYFYWYGGSRWNKSRTVDGNGNSNWTRKSITNAGNDLILSDDNTAWFWIHADATGARITTPATLATDAGGNRSFTVTAGGAIIP